MNTEYERLAEEIKQTLAGFKLEQRRVGERFGDIEEIFSKGTLLVRLVSDMGKLAVDLGSLDVPGEWFDVQYVMPLLRGDPVAPPYTPEVQLEFLKGAWPIVQRAMSAPDAAAFTAQVREARVKRAKERFG